VLSRETRAASITVCRNQSSLTSWSFPSSSLFEIRYSPPAKHTNLVMRKKGRNGVFETKLQSQERSVPSHEKSLVKSRFNQLRIDLEKILQRFAPCHSPLNARIMLKSPPHPSTLPLEDGICLRHPLRPPTQGERERLVKFESKAKMLPDQQKRERAKNVISLTNNRGA
jgi:hypothetical protein